MDYSEGGVSCLLWKGVRVAYYGRECECLIVEGGGGRVVEGGAVVWRRRGSEIEFSGS